ncbi:MAG TPA: TonB family protein [Vicinamibacterales bacterium]|nr:TonB family protein [Vicinamibacterales bacterium]
MRFQLAAIVLAAAVNAQDAAYTPARYASGNLPPSHPLAVAGGEVFLQVGVAADGHVTSASVLRTTPPFTEEMASAVRGWQFEPAKLGSTPVASQVFVAGSFTPPSLTGPTVGEPPQDVAPGSPEVAAPVGTVPARYPPLATGRATVLVEVTIERAGPPSEARLVVSSATFGDAALAAARVWSFRPAQRDGHVVTSRAYIVFGFQPPVVAQIEARPGRDGTPTPKCK